jgi:hypothetical protein
MDSTIPTESTNCNEIAGNTPTAYELNYSSTGKVTQLTPELGNSRNSKKMVLKCKACGGDFDSTFSVEEFSLLPEDQNKSGTLHLCPHCGNLSIYELGDYQEPK